MDLFWLVNGSTGEGTCLTIEERKQITEAWAAAVKETKQHLMIQVGGAALKDVKELVIKSGGLPIFLLIIFMLYCLTVKPSVQSLT